jgi:hypothetical protein
MLNIMSKNGAVHIASFSLFLQMEIYDGLIYEYVFIKICNFCFKLMDNKLFDHAV